MRVDGNISDLFFNTEHHFVPPDKNQGMAGMYDQLETEAEHFLACLDRLGVPTPTTEDLIADFYARL